MACNPWQRFWWIVAVLSMALVLIVTQGVLGWFLEHYSSPLTLIVSGFIVLVFLIFFVRAGSTAWRLRNELRTNLKISNVLLESKEGDNEKVNKILCSSLVTETCFGHAIEKLIILIHIQSKRRIGERFLPRVYEEEVQGLVDPSLSQPRFLFLLGLFGTILGVVYALTTNGTPQTAQEAKMFSFLALEGLGVAYTSTLFGICGGITLSILGRSFEQAERVLTVDAYFLFAYILLVVESDSFTYTPVIKGDDDE